MPLWNDLAHLKTAYPVVSDFRSYQDLYRRLLDPDYAASYKVITDVISAIATAEAKIRQENKPPVPPGGLHLSWPEWLKRGLRSLTG